MIARALRATSLVIVIAAIIDPTVTTNRTTRPEIAVVAADSTVDGTLTASIARNLSASFTVITAPYAAASGTVVVGSTLPGGFTELAAPVFAAIPDDAIPIATIETVVSPARTPLAARIPVTLSTRVTHARGRTLDVTLRLGDLMVDRVTRRIDSDDLRLRIPLSFVPVATGVQLLRVTTAITGSAESRAADIVVDVRETRWPVLFYDLRPSWMSTFVRRVLERDARFVVTSRVTASKGVSREAGVAPSSLDDPSIRSQYNVIVVGAPELLADRDIASLELFMRRRGGSVVLLFDQRASARSERLTAVPAWDGATRGVPVRVTAVDMDSVSLRVTDWMWPTRLPTGADTLAWSEPSARDSAANRHPVVWSLAVGAGRMVVSGALDAWKYRDPMQSGFESFWLRLMANAADASAAPVVVSVQPHVARPGQPVEVSMFMRDASLAPLATGSAVSVSASASLATTDTLTLSQQSVRLWPAGPVGQLRATVRAPAAAGRYVLRLNADGNAEDVPIVVRDHVAEPTPPDSELLAAWAHASGGQAIPASAGRRLANIIAQAVSSLPRRVTWHPMRSLWWLPLFSIPLCIEWWLRRRRGLP